MVRCVPVPSLVSYKGFVCESHMKCSSIFPVFSRRCGQVIVAAQAQHWGTGTRSSSCSTRLLHQHLFGERLQAHLALIQNGCLTVSADSVGKMQEYCATHFKVGGTIWNMSLTCTNKHHKNTSQSMLVCLHGETPSPSIPQPKLHDQQGLTVILLFSSSLICLLSLLSSVNCQTIYKTALVLHDALH